MSLNMLPKKTLKKLQGAPKTSVHLVHEALHLALHPQYLGNVSLGIVNFFNSTINCFNYKLNGILLGYGKIRLKESKAQVHNEEYHLHLDVFSEFWVFRPEIGDELQGVVNKKSPAHVSVLIHGLFNVPCHKASKSSHSEWAGSGVQVGDTVSIKVLRTDMLQKIPFILGELIGQSDDNYPDDVIQVEHIKKEKDWDQIIKTKDINSENEGCKIENDSSEQNIDKGHVSSDPRTANDSPTKKKKKKKHESRLCTSLIIVPDKKTRDESKARSLSPILTQAPRDSIDDDLKEDTNFEKKKKKKKKKKRDDESRGETHHNSVLESPRKEKKKDDDGALEDNISNSPLESPRNKNKSTENGPPCTENIKGNEDCAEDDKVKEDLANFLLAGVKSKDKKKKKKDKDVINDKCEELIASVKSKNKKKKKSSGSLKSEEERNDKEAPDYVANIFQSMRETVQTKLAEGKRRRTSSSDSDDSDIPDPKKARLYISSTDLASATPESPSAIIQSIRSPIPLSDFQRLQEPKLPIGWTFSVKGETGRKRKTWFSPDGSRFGTLKAAQNFIAMSK